MHHYHEEARKLYDGDELEGLIQLHKTDNTLADRIAELARHALKDHVPGAERPDKEEEALVCNEIGNVTFRATIEQVTSLDGLVHLMKRAEKERKSVKAVGGFYAFNTIIETDGFLVKTDLLKGVERITPSEDINHIAQANDIVYYKVLSGTRLKQLITELKKDGRGLPNLGGFDGQSIAGITSTSSHGSGVKIPPLCSFIASVHLVAIGGTQYRIEPTNGITSRDNFSQDHPDIELIQDDTVFHACVVGLGALGITYSFIISTIPIYNIIEYRNMSTWAEVRALLAQEPYDQNPILCYRNAEVWISPYTQSTLITRRRIATELDMKEHQRPKVARWWENLLREPLIHEVAARLSTSVGTALSVLLHLFPSITPKAIDTAILTQYHKDPVADTYDNIYVLGLVNDIGAIAVEFSLSMKDDNHLAAVDALMGTLRVLREKHGLSINGPMALRFSAASPQYMSMAHSDKGEPRCYVEMPILYAEGKYFYSDVYTPLTATALKFGARCHWGQFLSNDLLDSKYVRTAFDRKAVSLFRAQLARFDPQGLMANDILRKYRLTAPRSRKSETVRSLVASVHSRWRKVT